MKLTRILCVGITLFIAVAALAVPQQVNYQGQLTSPTGTALDTTVAMTFKLYGDSIGGTLLWTESRPLISVVKGLFNVRLGQLTTLDDAVVNQPQVWLGVTVGNNSEMTPRNRIVSVGYAYRVGTVDGASGGVINGKVNMGSDNSNEGSFAFVAGQNNHARGNNSVISGGGGSLASDSNSAGGPSATIGGGWGNTADGNNSTIAGGTRNIAESSYASVGGGAGNAAAAGYATVGGGSNNDARGAYSTVGGGSNNYARGENSVIAGGGGALPSDSNSASGSNATISGGWSNTANGNNGTIAGGAKNIASGTYATVSGGDSNSALYIFGTVGGGQSNTASNGHSTVSGGHHNIAFGPSSIVSGGSGNNASGDFSTICGGYTNSASGDASTVSGGGLNGATGFYSSIPGGYNNAANGRYSFAAGRNAIANHDGVFIWNDTTDAVFTSTGANQFRIRTSGGAWIYSGTGESAGVRLAPGGSAWTAVSDSTKKRNRRNVDTKSILEKVNAMPIQQWSYKSQDESIEHIGPMAQDFWREFHVGDDSLTISTIDPSGIALAAIQELAKEVRELITENRNLQVRMQTLELEKKQTMSNK